MPAKNFVLNSKVVSKVLETVDCGLSCGLDNGYGAVPGEICVEAAVCYALGLPHSDDPKCVDYLLRSLKISLNDLSRWSSSRARAKGLRKLAILQLGTFANFDERRFMDLLTKLIISKYLPRMKRSYAEFSVKSLHEDLGRYLGHLDGDGFEENPVWNYDAAESLYNVTSLPPKGHGLPPTTKAGKPFKRFARYQVRSAEYCGDEVVNFMVEYWEERGIKNWDRVLTEFTDDIADILIKMKVPARRFLDLL